MTHSLPQHVPVLPTEVLNALAPSIGKRFVDGTLGGGGHTKLLADAVGPTGEVIACDRDLDAVERASLLLQGLPVKVAQANYAEIPELLAQLEIEAVDGILLDLGLSSDQLACQERGFSFQSDGELDLRFDVTEGDPAWRMVQRLSAEHLADLIYQFGEERNSRRIARAIAYRNRERPLRTAREFAEVVRRAQPPSRDRHIDPATRTFQALRIAVNEELRWLDVALNRLPDFLAPGGRLAIISFHSLEDRMVKQRLRDAEEIEVLTRKPIMASEAEISENPRARSAKLRVGEKR